MNDEMAADVLGLFQEEIFSKVGYSKEIISHDYSLSTGEHAFGARVIMRRFHFHADVYCVSTSIRRLSWRQYSISKSRMCPCRS